METSPGKYALIVAGGKGVRMGTEVPKQFLLLRGRPLLMYTIEAFGSIPAVQVILVLPPGQFEYWQELCNRYAFSYPHELVAGGDTRFHSVRNGLKKTGEGVVAIHDGVRPLVSQKMISEAFSTAAEKGNAVAAVRLKDSIRELTLTGVTRNVNRNNYYLVQTPQAFRTDLIREAYENATHYNFTDDAGVIEEVTGAKINLIEGDYRNIKVTTSEDMRIAEALLD